MFQKTAEHFDSHTLEHVITLSNEDGLEHQLVLRVGHNSCPHCGAMHPVDPEGEIDPKAATEEALEELNRHHERVQHYVRRHNLKKR